MKKKWNEQLMVIDNWQNSEKLHKYMYVCVYLGTMLTENGKINGEILRCATVECSLL